MKLKWAVFNPDFPCVEHEENNHVEECGMISWHRTFKTARIAYDNWAYPPILRTSADGGKTWKDMSPS
jgi:hypothetical protein